MCLVYYRKCCNEILKIIIIQNTSLLFLLILATMESGVHLSVGVEMEAYGDQAAAASNQLFSPSLDGEPSRKPCDD